MTNCRRKRSDVARAAAEGMGGGDLGPEDLDQRSAIAFVDIGAMVRFEEQVQVRGAGTTENGASSSNGIAPTSTRAS